MSKLLKEKKVKVVLAPIIVKKQNVKKMMKPLFKKKPKNFGIGQDIQPKSNLTRFVKWPYYTRLQRQRAVLSKRLKVIPANNQFPWFWISQYLPSCLAYPQVQARDKAGEEEAKTADPC